MLGNYRINRKTVMLSIGFAKFERIKSVIMIATPTDTSLILSGYSFSLYNLDNFEKSLLL